MQILQNMRRGYSSDDYRRLIERVRAKVPNAGIATDIIVGFLRRERGQIPAHL